MLEKLSGHLLVSPSLGAGPGRKRHPEIKGHGWRWDGPSKTSQCRKGAITPFAVDRQEIGWPIGVIREGDNSALLKRLTLIEIDHAFDLPQGRNQGFGSDCECQTEATKTPPLGERKELDPAFAPVGTTQ
jgi:hypothetical protein